MARKQEFDPLGGFSGSGSRKSSRKNKKSYDVLGAGKYGDSGSIYDDSSYEPAPVTEYSDALLSTGYEESPKQKKQKPGLFGGLFKKKDKHSAAKALAASDTSASAARSEEEVLVPRYRHSADADISINDGVMETGIIQHYGERDDDMLFDDESASKTYPRENAVSKSAERAQTAMRSERYDESGYASPYDNESFPFSNRAENTSSRQYEQYDENSYMTSSKPEKKPVSSPVSGPVSAPAYNKYAPAKNTFVSDRKPQTDSRSEEISVSRQVGKPVSRFVDEDLFGEENPIAVPSAQTSGAVNNNYNDDLFMDTDKKVEEQVRKTPAARVPTSVNYHVCHLCGSVSKEELPEFGFDSDDFVPLCKVCTKAVSTLMKHTDPIEEGEIYSEWAIICPGLDEMRAKELVWKGRRSL